MKTSTEIGSFKAVGDLRKILRLVKDGGFEAYDFSMFRSCPEQRLIDEDDYLEKAKKLRAFADSINLPCNQAHAPFPTAIKGDEEYNRKTFPEIVRAIEVAGILGAKVCVVHPCNDYTPEENAEMYAQFAPYAKKAGVKIGVENMYNWDGKRDEALPAACSDAENYAKHMSLLDKDTFVVCLDLGHAEMRGLNTSAVELIEALAPRLGALHIHDNDRHYDKHKLPFTESIDFEPITAALKRVGYKGDITLEADTFLSRFPLSVYPQAVAFMAAVAKELKERVLN